MDDREHSLSLVARYPRTLSPHAKSKTGDIFDRWVMKFSQALLVEDIRKEFRFNLDRLRALDQLPQTLAAVPLVTEKHVLGTLRVNAPRPGLLNTHHLRLLDIIGDLSAVATRNMLLYEKTQELAIHDGLTDLYLLRYFEERLAEEIYRASHSHIPLSIVLLDIDYFKKVNDKYGHAMGDEVIRSVARSLYGNLREYDLVGRIGGATSSSPSLFAASSIVSPGSTCPPGNK